MKPKMTKEERMEERRSKKAFSYLISMAKKKGALVSVEYFNIKGKIGKRLTDED